MEMAVIVNVVSHSLRLITSTSIEHGKIITTCSDL